jgi:hypothetical protein
LASMELRFSLVPLLLLLLLTWPVTARQEVEVLLDVKNALDPQGMVLMSWQAGGQPCSGDFEGVLCDTGTYLAIKSIYLAKSVVGIYAKLTSGNDIFCGGCWLLFGTQRGELPTFHYKGGR